MMITEVKSFKTDSLILSYKLYGDVNNTTIIIETALGSCSAEWCHIAEKLSENYCVLIYDRAGYGTSTISTLERTPKNISNELDRLIKFLSIKQDIILVGHSQGALYCMQYALENFSNIKGVVLLDPATPFDNEFIERLTTDEYKNSGIDKTITYKIGKFLTSIGLGFTLKSLLKKSPPFYYFKFSQEAENYMLTALTKKKTYQTALYEYNCSHIKVNTSEIENAINTQALIDIPVCVITHSSEVFVKELEYYGNMDNNTALKIENIWQELMQRYLKLSSNSNLIRAINSSHFIHLTDLEQLIASINNIA